MTFTNLVGVSDPYFKGYDLGSKVYARHICEIDTLCILVKAQGDRTINESTGDAWFRNYTYSNAGPQYTKQAFKWVNEGGVAVGWEVSSKCLVIVINLANILLRFTLTTIRERLPPLTRRMEDGQRTLLRSRGSTMEHLW
jgi:hypothetical protein